RDEESVPDRWQVCSGWQEDCEDLKEARRRERHVKCHRFDTTSVRILLQPLDMSAIDFHRQRGDAVKARGNLSTQFLGGLSRRVQVDKIHYGEEERRVCGH